MTRNERIEAAANAIRDLCHVLEDRDDLIAAARFALDVAFPELAGEKPTHVLVNLDEIKVTFEGAGGPGSAAFLFERNGVNFAIKVPLPVSDQPTREQVSKLVDSLTEHDDVETVVTNLA